MPYVPGLNPLELGQALAAFACVLWLRALPEATREFLPRDRAGECAG